MSVAVANSDSDNGPAIYYKLVVLWMTLVVVENGKLCYVNPSEKKKKRKKKRLVFIKVAKKENRKNKQRLGSI